VRAQPEVGGKNAGPDHEPRGDARSAPYELTKRSCHALLLSM